jgi:hypothetical protein
MLPHLLLRSQPIGSATLVHTHLHADGHALPNNPLTPLQGTVIHLPLERWKLSGSLIVTFL